MIYSLESIKQDVNKKNKKNFEQLGGLSMYFYKTSNENFETEKDKVLEKLKEIEDKYTFEEFIPKEITSLGLEKKEFNAPSESEIKLEAENSLKEQKDNEFEKLQNSYSGKFSNLNDKIEDANLEREEDFNDALSNYKSSLKNATNSSIKQGISRSSIYNEALKAIEGEKNSDLKTAESEFNKEMQRLQNELSLLEKQKQNALDAFDISYAIKLENEIEKINNNIAKQQEEVDKYNNNVDKLEEANRKEQEEANLKEQKRIEEKNKELLEQKNKLGETGFINKKQKEKYDVVLNFLMNVPKEVAMEELTKDDYYEKLLGSYYSAIFAKILGRED